MNDNELNQLLSEFRAKEPSDFQIHKWKRATHTENHSIKPIHNRSWFQAIAASVIGFVVGGFVFSSKHSLNHSQELSKNVVGNATIEYVLTKTN